MEPLQEHRDHEATARANFTPLPQRERPTAAISLPSSLLPKQASISQGVAEREEREVGHPAGSGGKRDRGELQDSLEERTEPAL